MNNTGKKYWPGWETVQLIGRGSFGAVYEIQRKLFEDEEEVEKAALKVISIPQNDSDIEEMYNDGYDEESVTSTFHAHLKSIVAEYSLMRKMNGSSNIVNCDDVRYVQHDDGIGWDIYIKMELLTPLTKALPATVSEEQIIKIAKDMCAALELCQKYNILHRDIKPQNIFVSKNGDYKLGDFGIAKTVEKTMGGTKTGTYKYMAPEVYSNQPYNNTADIYSLGLVLYWLLNERRMPFMPLPPEKLKAGMEEESRHRRFSGEKIPMPKNGSKELKQIVLKACAFDPKDRYQSAREMREDLLRLSGGQTHVQNEELFEEEKTIGPVLTHSYEENETEEKTVGPVFTSESTAGMKEKKIKKQSKILLVFVIVAIVLVVGFFTIHVWSEATCTQPSVCSLCGKEKEPALGHQWKSANCIEAKTCKVCGLTEGEATGHNWGEATCEVSKTCSVCGATEGTAMGHEWQEATCTTGPTCSRCGLVEGDPAGHTWQEATYTTAKTCIVCNLVEGTPLESPPIIVVQEPRNASASKGERIAVFVQATGENLRYQWWMASAGSDEFKLSSNPSCLYTTILSDKSIGRRLYCVITDENGNECVTDIVLLSEYTEGAEKPIIITKQPTGVTAAYGETIAITVEATGENLQYEWWWSPDDESLDFQKAEIQEPVFEVTLRDVHDDMNLVCLIIDANGNYVISNMVKIEVER